MPKDRNVLSIQVSNELLARLEKLVAEDPEGAKLSVIVRRAILKGLEILEREKGRKK